MNRLLQKLINYFFPFKEGEFPATPKGFRAAQKWAQSQPHSYSENLSLWEEMYEHHMDGYWTLAKINEQKRLADKYKGVKENRKNTKKYSLKKS
jgi:hypothetical protein